MSQLVQLRRRIKSIQTTKKITYAMRLISMSLYGRLEKQSSSLKLYQNTISKLYSSLTASQELSDLPNIVSQDPLAKTPLIILVSSSKGLCGSFNSGLFKFFNQSYYAQEHQKPAFITVGSKATSFIRDGKARQHENKIGSLIASYDNFSSNTYLDIAHKIFEHITNAHEKFASVTAYSNVFRTFFLQQPHKTRIAPLEGQKINQGSEQTQSLIDIDNTIFEQDIHEIIKHLTNQYLKSSLQGILFQSLLSEQASRFVAMDNATTNADKMLDKLTLQYNKSRQAAITRELTELSAGFAQYR